MKRYAGTVGSVLVVAVLLWLFVAAANAQPIEPLDVIDVEIGTIAGDPFELVFIAELSAEAGDSCIGQLDARNNESTRDDTSIVLISGGVIVAEFFGVETEGFDGAGLGFTAIGPVEAHVRLGVRGIYSAGILLEVTCNPPVTSTTSSIPSGTTSLTSPDQPPTTASPATTTTLPRIPVGVDTGYGAPADDGWVVEAFVGGLAGALLVFLFVAALGFAGVGDRKDRHES